MSCFARSETANLVPLRLERSESAVSLEGVSSPVRTFVPSLILPTFHNPIFKFTHKKIHSKKIIHSQKYFYYKKSE
jgi:hypothetical protein